MAHVNAISEGTIASFKNGAKVPITNLKYKFSPTQEGTGAPSVENIRPFIWKNNCTIYHGQGNVEDTVTFNINFPEEVENCYGCILDITNGTLAITHGIHIFDGTENIAAVGASGGSQTYHE